MPTKITMIIKTACKIVSSLRCSTAKSGLRSSFARSLPFDAAKPQCFILHCQAVAIYYLSRFYRWCCAPSPDRPPHNRPRRRPSARPVCALRWLWHGLGGCGLLWCKRLTRSSGRAHTLPPAPLAAGRPPQAPPA